MFSQRQLCLSSEVYIGIVVVGSRSMRGFHLNGGCGWGQRLIRCHGCGGGGFHGRRGGGGQRLNRCYGCGCGCRRGRGGLTRLLFLRHIKEGRGRGRRGWDRYRGCMVPKSQEKQMKRGSIAILHDAGNGRVENFLLYEKLVGICHGRRCVRSVKSSS